MAVSAFDGFMLTSAVIFITEKKLRIENNGKYFANISIQKSHSEQSEESVEGTIPPSAALTPPFTQGRHNDSSA